MSIYVLSQIFVVIATIILGATYFLKDKVKILILCMLYCVFYGGHYLLLGALTGGMMNLVSLFRNYIFFKNSKKEKKNSIYVLILLILISIVFCAISYKNIFSIISMIASILSTYSVWQDNVKKYKILAIPVSICFLVYAISINSVAAIITEGFLLTMEILALIKLYINTKNIDKKLKKV